MVDRSEIARQLGENIMADPIVIWGAGAIGGTMGAHFVRAGHEVVFVDIVPAHVEAIRSGNLKIDGGVSNFTVGADAFTPDRVKGTFGRIMLAVKAHHTVEATRALAPHLAPDGYVVSCQNGLNEPVIAEIVGRERTVGAFVNYATDWMGPGHITFGNRGAVVIGELDGARSERIEALHKVLVDFEPNALISDNIYGYLWGKAAFGAILKASALTNMTMIEFFLDRDIRPLIAELTGEVLRIARAEGVRPLGFQGFEPDAFLRGDEEAMDTSLRTNAEMRRNSDKKHSGPWRDLAVRKRKTDVAAQLGPVQAAARRHGMASPMIDHLVALIRRIEDGERQVGDGLEKDLLATALKVRADAAA